MVDYQTGPSRKCPAPFDDPVTTELLDTDTPSGPENMPSPGMVGTSGTQGSNLILENATGALMEGDNLHAQESHAKKENNFVNY